LGKVVSSSLFAFNMVQGFSVTKCWHVPNRLHLSHIRLSEMDNLIAFQILCVIQILIYLVTL
jgi:hypothetical protein